MGTPGPIPNPAVKQSTVVAKVSPEGARIARCRAFFFYGPLRGFFRFVDLLSGDLPINKYVRAYACARTIKRKVLTKIIVENFLPLVHG